MNESISNVRHYLYNHVPQVSYLLSFASDTLAAIYGTLVIWPISRLYRHGPALFGVGFWRGIDSVDICASLTGMPAKHWQDNLDTCEARIEADILSYVILLETFVYFFVLYYLIQSVLFYSHVLTSRFLQDRGWIQRYSPRLLGWVRHSLKEPSAGKQKQQKKPKNGHKKIESDAESNSSNSSSSISSGNMERKIMTRARALASALAAAKAAATAGQTSSSQDSSPYSDAYAPK